MAFGVLLFRKGLWEPCGGPMAHGRGPQNLGTQGALGRRRGFLGSPCVCISLIWGPLQDFEKGSLNSLEERNARAP